MKKMMTKTHISIGYAAGFLAAQALGIQPGIEYIAAAAIGSMIPDIDHPSSKINKKILPVSNGADKIAVYILMAFLAGYLYMKNQSMAFIIYTVPVFLIVAFSKHRGITHSLVGMGMFVFVVSKICKELGCGVFTFPFAIGYIMHILADMLTNSGVQLFYPVQKKIKLISGFKTNGSFEKVLFYISSAFAAYMAFKVYF